MVHEAASAGFGRSAEAYDRGRPEYPAEAIDWLFDALGLAAGSHVVDVGAGTGKLTRPLAERGAEVTAVEPVREMRERIAIAAPEAAARPGTAEQLPVEDTSADAVVAGQAFHGFANERALAEFHRVLRPAGTLGLIWNRRDPSHPLHEKLRELMEPHRAGAPTHAHGAWREALEATDLFEPLASHELDFVQELGPDGLVDRVGSVSFIAALAEPARAELLERVRGLAPDAEPARLPYTCEILALERGG